MAGSLAAVGLTASVALAAVTYFQGFEIDTAGWFDFGAGTVVRTASGTTGVSYANGISSAAGDFHARLNVNASLCSQEPPGPGEQD